MLREISSTNQTDFYQHFPIVLLSFIFMVLAVNFNNLSENWFASSSYLLAFLAVSIVIIRLLFKLKRVEILDFDKGLVIQTTSPGSSKRILVPMEIIKNVSQVFFMSHLEIIAIELTITTEFGDKIRFIPKFRSPSFGDHPIVAELNDRIEQYHYPPKNLE